VLAEKRNSGVFALVSGVNQVLRYDVPRELLAALRLRPDLAIDTEQWHRLSAVVARLTSAGTLIGFATNERARLFHHAVPYSHDDYEAESFFHLLNPLGIGPPPALAVPFLSVPEQTQSRAAHLLTPLAGKPFVTLFPGASIAERRWGTERFAEVASRLARQGYTIVVVGGKNDRSTGEALAAAAGGLNLAGQTSLAETAAILAQSALLISGDSGVLHLAVGVGTPTVSLFGPGITQKWAPRGPRHRVIDQEFPCSPCTRFGYTARCPRQAACLRQITPAMVIEAASSLLATLR
ncbi:MAG TPA: glycosyltransferase family 9 protein, partial [Desulfurivibrionaceae bacterium]|nr:glycosyltransferase family 9 protein [Desulfurivibrionaceae bacterium]